MNPAYSPQEATERAEKLNRDLAAKDAYIARLLDAGWKMADVTTEHRRNIWLDAVNSSPGKDASEIQPG